MKKQIFDRLAAATRLDGWANPLTGLGTTRDKMISSTFARGRVLCETELDALYAENDMAARICEALPEDAAREGFSIKVDSEDRTAADRAHDRLEELGALCKLVDAWVWGRVFGWGALYIGAADGAEGPRLAEPLDVRRARGLDFLNVIDRRYATPLTWYEDATQPKHGQPRSYIVTPSALPQGPTAFRSSEPLAARARRAAGERGAMEIHESRLIVFGGVRTTIQRRRENQGFSDPLLQRVNTVLTQFGVSWDSLAHILQDAYQGVYKVKGFIDALAGTDPGALQTRWALIDMARSAIRAVILDADMEEFERQSPQLAGLDKIMELFMIRLASAAGMPATVLMSQSPAGMNATGESDMRWWYNRVDYAREHTLKPALRTLIELVFSGLGAPDGWAIEFPALWEPTESERADIRAKQAQTDKIYIELGVATESEIALSRFTPDGWSPDTTIDREARLAMVEDEVDELGEDDPTPPPMIPAPAAPDPPDGDA